MAYEKPVYPLGTFTGLPVETALRSIQALGKTVYTVTVEIDAGQHKGTRVDKEFWVEDAGDKDYEALEALGYDGSDLRTAKLPNRVQLKIVESKTKPGKQLIYVNALKAQSAAPVDVTALKSVAANFRAFKARKNSATPEPAYDPSGDGESDAVVDSFDRF